MMELVDKNILDKNYTLGIAKEYEKEETFLNDFLILTNNSKVESEFSNTVLVEGSFREVLIKAKEMVYEGHKIISYPLAASIRMMYSPTRSILISLEANSLDERSIEIIDASIEKYDLTMGARSVDEKNKKDYEIIDYDLIISAIRENDFIKKTKKI